MNIQLTQEQVKAFNKGESITITPEIKPTQCAPTLTPVSFESKGELAKALVDGRTFKTYSGLTLMHDASSAYYSPFRIMRDGEDVYPMLGVWDLYDDLQEINAAPQPWYLNIPEEGIECYVSDDEPNPSCDNRIIREYNSRLSFPFRSSILRWKYATPVNGGK